MIIARQIISYFVEILIIRLHFVYISMGSVSMVIRQTATQRLRASVFCLIQLLSEFALKRSSKILKYKKIKFLPKSHFLKNDIQNSQKSNYSKVCKKVKTFYKNVNFQYRKLQQCLKARSHQFSYLASLHHQLNNYFLNYSVASLLKFSYSFQIHNDLLLFTKYQLQ